MTWDGAGHGHWDVVLSGMITIPLDDWIGFGAIQYVLELEAQGAGLLKPMAPMSER
jgi:hypothetical protein